MSRAGAHPFQRPSQSSIVAGTSDTRTTVASTTTATPMPMPMALITTEIGQGEARPSTSAMATGTTKSNQRRRRDRLLPALSVAPGCGRPAGRIDALEVAHATAYPSEWRAATIPERRLPGNPLAGPSRPELSKER